MVVGTKGFIYLERNVALRLSATMGEIDSGEFGLTPGGYKKALLNGLCSQFRKIEKAFENVTVFSLNANLLARWHCCLKRY